MSVDGAIRDALFEDSLSNADMEAALKVAITRGSGEYSDSLYTDGLDKLVSFADLIGIDVKQKVALADYDKIAAIVKKSWADISSGKLYFVQHT